MLDKKAEQNALTAEELYDLRSNTLDMHSLSRLSSSISCQQSRLLWLQDCDVNSKYFHVVMTGRWRVNSISSLVVNGSIVEGVHPVREVVFNYFSDQFKSIESVRPSMDGMVFRQLDYGDGVPLVRPFSIDEVKAAVWDCDNFKSPGPDGINFGFIKEFRSEMSGDIMSFIGDFHRNGKLTKGINSTSITLIPKVESPQKLNGF